MNTDLRAAFLKIPTRQSPIAIFLILAKVLRQLVRQAWPFLLVIILRNFNFTATTSTRSEDPFFTQLLIGITLFSTVSSIIAYFKFYYYVKDDELVIKKGVLQKVNINLPFDRIQTINFEQNLIHRLFNVVRMEVDSAGSMQSEISIQAIKREEAEYIRSYIMAEKAKRAPSEVPTALTEVPEAAVANEEILLQHSPIDLLKIGVSQNHLRGLGIIFGFAFWIFQSVEEFLPSLEEGENPIDYAKDLGVNFDTTIWVSFLIVLLLISIVLSLLSTVFRYFNLRFIRTDQRLKVVSGLFTKREQSANINKIQLIRWSDSILKRIFGIFRLYLYQASSAALSASKAIGIPGCYLEQIDTVRATYFPTEQDTPYEIHAISPLIIGRRVLYRGVVPTLLLIGLSYQESNYHYLAWLLLIPFVFFTSRIFHKNWKVHINKEGVLTEHGIIGKQFTLLQWYKIQSVSLRQSLYQQRKEVADVYFYTAAGSVKIPYFPLDKALAIKNYVLYQVETDERDWM